MASCGTVTDPAALSDDASHPAAALPPLRERIWERYGAGESRSAIARALQVDRETVSRHSRVIAGAAAWNVARPRPANGGRPERERQTLAC